MKVKVKSAKNSVKDFIVSVYNALRMPEMVILPGNLAFYFVLAIIPSLALISYGASMLNLSVDFLYNFIANSFSKEMADLIFGVQLSNTNGINFFITVIIGIYIASNGADSIILSSNTVYGIKNKTWIKRRFKAIGLTFLIVFLLMFMLVVPVFGNTITNLITEVNLNEVVTNQILAIYNLIQGPLTWLIMFIIIKIIYVVAPDKKRENRVINYGAWFTTVGWIVGTKIFSLYISNYANYTVLYGGFATLVVFMVWIYYLSLIFTIGIALNYKKDEDKLLKNGIINNSK